MKTKACVILLVSIGFFSIFPLAGAAGTLQDVMARGKLIVGVEPDRPPFSFLDRKGTYKGFRIDVAKAFSRELFKNEKAVEFVSVTPENGIPLLMSRKIDVIAATLTITEERERDVYFSAPYSVTAQMILVRADSRITKYQDLAGRKVATIRGSDGDIAVRELVPDANRITFERNSEALQALKGRRVEAFVQDFVVLYGLLQKNRGLKMGGLQPFRPARYGLAVRKGENEWLDFINATFAKMRGNGELERILDKWFSPAPRALLKSFEAEK